MKQIFTFLCALLLFLSLNAAAMQCPKVIDNVTFVHPAAGQVWLIDMAYNNQGWFIVRNPALENSSLRTIFSNSTLSVVVNGDDKDNFYFTCNYQSQDSSALSVTNTVFHPAPINSNFQQVSPTTYICNTQANNPEYCADPDIRPVSNQLKGFHPKF